MTTDIQGRRFIVLLGLLSALSITQAVAADLIQNKLNGAELEDKTCEALRIMRNEIFARHGRKFSDPKLREHFLSQEWYRPKYSPRNFPDDKITDVQETNIHYIQHFEEEKECKNPRSVFDISRWGILEWSAACVGLAAILTILRMLYRVISKRARGVFDSTE